MLLIATDALTELYLMLFVGVIPLTMTLLLLLLCSNFNIAALYVDEIRENSSSVMTLSSMHVEINADNLDEASTTMLYREIASRSLLCEHDDIFLVIAVVIPASVVIADIAIGTATGAIIVTDERMIPADANTPDIE